jgi:hypothetical protein
VSRVDELIAAHDRKPNPLLLYDVLTEIIDELDRRNMTDPNSMEPGKLTTGCFTGNGKPTDAELRNRFYYHPPTPDTLPRFAAINDACFALAKVIRDTVPVGRGLSLALTQLEEVRMRANFGIATETSEAVTPTKP